MSNLIRRNTRPGSFYSPVGTIFYPGEDQDGLEWFLQPMFQYDFLSHYEAITEQTGNNRKKWNDFEHYKCSSQLASNGSTFASNYVTLDPSESHIHVFVQDPMFPLSYQYGRQGTASFSGISSYVDVIPDEGSFLPPPDNLSLLLQSALKSMMPGVKSELSLANSLLELRDFKSLPRTISSQFAKLPSGFKALRDLLRRGSNVYLQKEFNVEPLLSDICGIHTTVKHIEKRLRILLNAANKKKQRHYQYFINTDNAFSDQKKTFNVDYGQGSPFNNPPIIGSCSSDRFVSASESVFHVEIEYTFKFTQYQLEHAQALAFLDSMGLNLNPQIIWNAIPWSFVVDWVLGVSRWLGQFSSAQLDPIVNIHRCLWSWKRSRRIVVLKQVGFNDFGIVQTPYTPAFSTIESSYKRTNFTPGIAELSVGGLSPKEISLGGALAFARKPRHSKQKWRRK